MLLINLVRVATVTAKKVLRRQDRVALLEPEVLGLRRSVFLVRYSVPASGPMRNRP